MPYFIYNRLWSALSFKFSKQTNKILHSFQFSIWNGSQVKLKSWLTTFPHEECIDRIALSRTYKSTALSSGRVEVKLKPKSIRTYKQSIWLM